jgi:serine/threonine protein kinase/Rieske Fe-S protein
MQTSVEHLIDQTLGHYRLEQLLGRGKVNAVYIARHIERGETVMLTAFIIPPEFSSDARERYLQRFEQVMSALRALDHPYILPVYDAGNQSDYPYMVTPLVTSGSLARTLKQQERVSPTQALALLKQVASALDYAHSKGTHHGILKPLNIMLDDALNVRMAGFGLTHILEMRGIEPVDGPYAHLYSVAHTFLGAPEYIAPEVVLGTPVNARSDIYALGIILFEMLTGKVPFSGVDPLSVAMMHVQQSMPSIQMIYPETPVALDLVVQRALERDPGKRYQSASQLVIAFERVLQVIEKGKFPSAPAMASQSAELQNRWDRDKTMAPVVSFFHGLPNDKEGSNLSQSQRLNARSYELPRNSAKLPAMNDMGNWQIVPPIITSSLPAINPSVIAQPPFRQAPMAASPMGKEPFAERAIDPFVWASTASVLTTKPSDQAPPGRADQQSGTPKKRSPRRRPTRPLTSNGSPDKGRRRTVALLAGGGVVMAGLLGVGGVSLAHLLQLPKQTQTAHNQPATAPAQNARTATTPTAKKQAATKTMQKTNKTKQPAKPTQPKAAHTGTVIGASTQAVRSSKVFTNPADGKESLLVHLPNGNFVAYERACTHQQVAVDYDAATGHLICPLHHSEFDPANNGSVLVGPAQTPLPKVAVRVNADGTVTTG